MGCGRVSPTLQDSFYGETLDPRFEKGPGESQAQPGASWGVSEDVSLHHGAMFAAGFGTWSAP